MQLKNGRKYEQTLFNAVSKNKVRIMCSFFSCCCDKITFKKQLKEKRFILAQGLRLWGTIDRKKTKLARV